MTHPQLARRGSFGHLRLGRKPARPDPRTLSLAHYFRAPGVGEIPVTTDYAAAVPRWPLYGNKTVGDCTCAAAAHLLQAWTAAAGRERKPTYAQVLELYWQTGAPAAATGTRHGPTDDGREAIKVLNYWRQTGLAGSRIGAYVTVDASDLHRVQAAIHVFGGVYVGLGLPKTARNQPVWEVVGDGKTGDSAVDSWGGHVVPYVGYEPGFFTCVTWGSPLQLSEAFHLAYAEEVYAVIAPDFFTGPHAPRLDRAKLEADIAYVAG
jgi:hypothetical protein